MKGKIKNNLLGYLFISPPIIGFLLFSLIPICYSLIVSFTDFTFYQPMHFIGFKNFIDIFKDPVFALSMKNNFIALIGVPFQIAAALLVATLLNMKVRGQALFRTMFFIPGLCSSVAIALVWKWIYNTDYGLLNGILNAIGIKDVNWLGDKKIVMISMIIQGIWMGMGGGMIMYIAALKGVPKQYYEAAEIDGASSFRVFFTMTIPMISPTTLYLAITTTMGALQDFARYKMMTDGGPGDSSQLSVLYIYKLVFKYTEYGYGYATGMAWIVGLLILGLIGLIFATSKWWVHYGE